MARLVDLHAKTVIVDVEPLAAFRDTDEETLRRGATAVLDRIATKPEVTVVGFATNSRRRLALNSTSDSVRVLYVAAADNQHRFGHIEAYLEQVPWSATKSPPTEFSPADSARPSSNASPHSTESPSIRS